MPPTNRYLTSAGMLAWWMAAMMAMSGCASSGRGGLPFNTATHRLLDVTKQLRSSFPYSQPLPRELDKGVLPAYYVEPGDTLLVQPAIWIHRCDCPRTRLCCPMVKSSLAPTAGCMLSVKRLKRSSVISKRL